MKKFWLTVAVLLCLLPAAVAECMPVELNGEMRYAANLFLSNFTEVGCDAIGSSSDDMVLVDFAHDHLWFNDHDAFEYFYDAPVVDLSWTRFDYDGGYYYHCETGGWMDCGFAQTVSVCPVGDDYYFVSFMVFGGGDIWDNSMLHLSIDQAEARFGHPNGYGSALIHAANLADRSTYRMVSYAPV